MRLPGELTKDQVALVEERVMAEMKKKSNEEKRRTETAERKPVGQFRIRDNYCKSSNAMSVANRFRNSEASKQIERESREAREKKDRERKAKINNSRHEVPKMTVHHRNKPTIASALAPYLPH